MSDRSALSPWRRFLRSPLAGFSLGMGIVAAFFALYYAVPTYLQPRLSETAVVERGRWTFHLRKDAPLIARLDEVIDQYEAELGEVLQTLSIPPSALPETIHVFLHPDWPSVRRAILQRHSPTYTEVLSAVIDVLEGQSPRPALVELASTLAWGPSRSRLLKAGLDGYLGHPQSDWTARAAAWLGPDFLGLPQLVRLEARGGFPPSLYESFNAPQAKARLDLPLLGRLIRTNLKADLPQELQRTEAAALVQFVVASRGWPALRRLWDAPSLERGVFDLFGTSLLGLDARWRDGLVQAGPARPSFAAWRGLALAQRGQRRAAQRWWRRALEVPDLSPELRLQVRLGLARVALEAGDWSRAEAALGPLDAGSPAVQLLRRRLEGYRRWRSRAGEHVRLHAAPTLPAESLGELVARADAGWSALQRRLQLADEELPEDWVIFLYAGTQQRSELVGADPLFAPRRGVAHLLPDEAPLPWLARLMVGALRPPSDSPFLTQGLVEALSDPAGALARARRRLEDRGWVPLSQLSFDGARRADARLEAAALIDFLLEQEGIKWLKRLWALTSPLEENLSFFSALERASGRPLDELEAELMAFLQP